MYEDIFEMYEDIFKMFQSWREPKFCILDLYQEKKLLDLNYICSGGVREGMPLIFRCASISRRALILHNLH